MPNCKRCGKLLSDDEFFVCTDCEEEELYQDEFLSEDDFEEELDENHSYQ